MSLEDALEHYRRYFNEKIDTHGAVPQGVDYNGPEAAIHPFSAIGQGNRSRPAI